IIEEGIQHLSHKMRIPNDITNVHITLLALVYTAIQSPSADVWISSGAAMRSCLELELHPEFRAILLDRSQCKLYRRVFWAAYCMGRSVCSALRR
ncbi:uncharacterized protein A1O9_10283, partial [Exophiala aquamarina CBS 119918]